MLLSRLHSVQDVIVEQMLVGMLFLAPMAATLPTTWLLHCVFALVHAAVAFLRMCAYAAACFLDSGCAFRLVQWVCQPLFGGTALGAEPDVEAIDTLTVSIVQATSDHDDCDKSVAGLHSRRNRKACLATNAQQLQEATSGGSSHETGDWQSQQLSTSYPCPVTYYRVNVGFVSVQDAVRPAWDVMLREMSFMQPWVSRR